MEPCDKLFDELLAALKAHDGIVEPADVMEAVCALAATTIRNAAPLTSRTETELAKYFGEQLLRKLGRQPTGRAHWRSMTCPLWHTNSSPALVKTAVGRRRLLVATMDGRNSSAVPATSKFLARSIPSATAGSVRPSG
jgi:hypothetical protein